eukprot:6344786-Prymnesium_polylepis.1
MLSLIASGRLHVARPGCDCYAPPPKSFCSNWVGMEHTIMHARHFASRCAAHLRPLGHSASRVSSRPAATEATRPLGLSSRL